MTTTTGSSMRCLVTLTPKAEGTAAPADKPITLVEPTIHNVCPADGENVTIVEYRVEGALIDAIPNEMENLDRLDDPSLTVKRSTIRWGPDMPDIITLSPVAMTADNEADLDHIKRIELWLGDCFIATGAIDRATHVVRFAEEKLTIPLAGIPDVPVITNIYVDDPDTDPKMCYQGFFVEDKESIKKIKVNIVFTYSGTRDMDILSAGDGKAGILYPRRVKSSSRVCCLHSSAPPDRENPMTFTKEEFEAWLEANYIHCPPLPITLPMAEYL